MISVNNFNKYLIIILVFTTLGCKSIKENNHNDIVISTTDSLFSKSYIEKQMRLAADWQLKNLDTIGLFANGDTEPVPDNGWVRASFFTGVMETYKTTGDKKYLNAAIELGIKNSWQPGERPRHADDHCIIQTYAQIYFITKTDSVIKPAKQLFDSIVKLPYLSREVGWSQDKNWSWSDALFMGPPAWAMMAKATGNDKYLEVMDAMWWDTYNYLYDPTEDLFFRDDRYKVREGYDALLTSNGKKVFWGRGNGWVIGGMTRMLKYLPVDFHNRTKYEDVFKAMSNKLANTQGEDGLWRSSLVDFDEYPSPETSATGFFCYGLAWGINQGLLDKEVYLPVVNKAWEGLCWAMNYNGKLGYVQLIGHDPKIVTKDDNMEYGTGAFLLAASEMFKLNID